MSITRRQFTVGIALFVGLAAIVCVTFGFRARAWGDGSLCYRGVTHTFQTEADYYAYLNSHPGATEGKCTSPATSAAPPTTLPSTTQPPKSTVPPTSPAPSTTSGTPASTAAPSTSVPPTSVATPPDASTPAPPTTSVTPSSTPSPITATRGPVAGQPPASTRGTGSTVATTLPATGGRYSPHDLLWGAGAVLLGLGMLRVGMRRRQS